MFAQAIVVGVMPEGCRVAEHLNHVLGDRLIHVPQIGKIKAAMPAGIPPSEKKVSDKAALAGVTLCDLQQAVNRINITVDVSHATCQTMLWSVAAECSHEPMSGGRRRSGSHRNPSSCSASRASRSVRG